MQLANLEKVLAVFVGLELGHVVSTQEVDPIRERHKQVIPEMLQFAGIGIVVSGAEEIYNLTKGGKVGVFLADEFDFGGEGILEFFGCQLA